MFLVLEHTYAQQLCMYGGGVTMAAVKLCSYLIALIDLKKRGF